MNGMNQQRIIMESYIENFSFKLKKKKKKRGVMATVKREERELWKVY